VIRRGLLATGRRALAVAAAVTAGLTPNGVALATVPSGDVNQDGRLDSADALLGLRMASGDLAPSPDADVAPLGSAPDGVVDAGDALLLLRAPLEDVDGDGLPSEVELAAGTSPFRSDSDADSLADGAEVAGGSDPTDPDSDDDGLVDGAEPAAARLDPDADGDGLVDGEDPAPAVAAGEEVVWIHADHLGSPLALTDLSGNVVRRLRYGVFGELRASVPGPGADGTTPPAEAFNGHRHDAEIGLSHYGARDYAPALGRFLQPDPIVPEPEDPQTLNRYAYVRSDPLNRIDPSGHLSIHFTGASAYLSAGTYLYDSFGEGGFTGVDVRYAYWRSGDTWSGALATRVYAFGREPEFSRPELYAVRGGRITDALSSVGEAAAFLAWLAPDDRNLYVNGILQESPADVAGNIDKNLGVGVLVFNPSDGLLNDLIEAVLQKFMPGSTRLDRTTADLLHASGAIARAWGHSQGALTVRNAELIAGIEGSRGRLRRSVLAGLPGSALIAGWFRRVAGGQGDLHVRQHRYDPFSILSLNPGLVLTGSYGLVRHGVTYHKDAPVYSDTAWDPR
jgi:RHS repeat-associated protein